MVKRAGLMAALLAIGGVYAAAQVSAPATPATQKADAEKWQPVLAGLSDADPHLRELAQEQLDKTTWRDLSELEDLALHSREAEAQARLANRIAAIKEQIAEDPPPISVDFKNASLEEVCKVFGKTLDVTLFAQPTTQRQYTYKAADKPLWEVINDLQLNLIGPETAGYMVQEKPRDVPSSVFGILSVTPVTLERRSDVDLRRPAGDPREPDPVDFVSTWVVDPRVKVLEWQTHPLETVTDDRGNVLYTREARDAPAWVPDKMNATISVWWKTP